MIIPLIIIMNMKAITITNHLLVESRDTRKAYFQKKEEKNLLRVIYISAYHKFFYIEV